MAQRDFLIKVNNTYKKINLENIYYFQVEGKYTSIILETRSYSIRTSLKALIPQLPDNFLRIHTSYLVNLDKVDSVKVSPSLVVLSNGSELQLSRTYKKAFLDRFHLG